MAERKAQHPSSFRRIVPASSSEDGEEETGGDVDLARDYSDGGSSGGGVVLWRASSRRERHSLRRVQPLGEDESEEARVRGVPVPAVHLPDGSAKMSTGDGGSGGAGSGGVGVRGSPVSMTRNAYVAAQLKQLSRAVNNLPDYSGEGGSNSPLPTLLHSPSAALQQHQRQPLSPSAGPSPSGDSPVGPRLGPGETQSPTWLTPLSGGARPPGVVPSQSFSGTGAGGSTGATADSAAGVAVAGADTGGTTALGAAPVAASSAAATESSGGVMWSQSSSVRQYLVSQLSQLSQLLDSPPRGAATGDSTSTGYSFGVGPWPTSASSRGGGGWGTAEGGGQGAAAGSGNGRGGRSRQASDVGSLQYSLSAASSSRSSSPYSPSAAVAAAAWASVPDSKRDRDEDGEGEGESEGESEGGEGGVETGNAKYAGDAKTTATHSALAPAPAPAPLRSPAAPFEGGVETLDGARAAARGGAERLPALGEGKASFPGVPSDLMSPISGHQRRRSSRSELYPGVTVPSAAAVREDDLEEGSSGKIDDDDDDDDEHGDEEEARARRGSSSSARQPRHARESSAESGRRYGSSRVGANMHMLTEAFGRARLWRRMLAADSRAESAVMADIVAENQGALDQGVVLPCAPSDEEKLMYHKTGRGFLVGCGVISVFALSAGMWLFTFAATYFYWFGVPTAFIMGYLLLSYFGVAVWGKEFDPEAHAVRIRRAEHESYYPTVDVFLPVCREPTHLLDNTWKYVRALDYPSGKVSIHVLDDGAKEEVRQLAAMHGFNYIRRTNIPELKKAGNLRYAFARTSGEFIVIFDADFCPRPEFLRETTPYFKDEDVAILQTPQFFRYREEQTWVEKGAGVTQELFYRMVQVNRNKFDASICVGTCGVYRREALAPFGGTAAIGYSEDVHTGFNCAQLGYKVRYIPQVLAMGTCPDEPRAFFMQQYRWCMGSTTLLFNRDFWGSNLSRMQKLCYLSGMFYYSATALTIFTGPLPGMLLIWFKPKAVLWFNISFAVPSIFFGFVGMRCWANQKYDLSCQRVKVIQSFSHLYALKDKLMNTTVPWVPTGGGASSRSSSQAYDSSVKLMLVWTMTYTLLTIGGAAWRVTEFPWYHFLPTILLSILNFGLHISTLL